MITAPEKSLVFILGLYCLYCFVLLLYSAKARFRALSKREVSVSSFHTYAPENLTEELIIRSRHFDNQFQVPILFFVALIAALYCRTADWFTVGLATCFFLSRIVHSFIHLGTRSIRARAGTYFVGWIILLGLWIKTVVLLA